MILRIEIRLQCSTENGKGRHRSNQPGSFNILEQAEERMDNEDVRAD